MDFLIENFRKKNIKFIFNNTDELFNSIIFNKYLNVDFWDNLLTPKFNDFYDYIIYIILNLKK